MIGSFGEIQLVDFFSPRLTTPEMARFDPQSTIIGLIFPKAQFVVSSQ